MVWDVLKATIAGTFRFRDRIVAKLEEKIPPSKLHNEA